MTNPVVLLGTQSNGETLPVQVDATGRLVAEGLQGPQGEDGAQGPPGNDGGAFPLPPDPYEGALLGWLNGGLAWLNGSIPIPEDVFGPITAWDAQSSLITVRGPIPETIQNGVYLTQTDQQGFPTRPDEPWNISQEWSSRSDSDHLSFDGSTAYNPATMSFEERFTVIFLTTPLTEVSSLVVGTNEQAIVWVNGEQVQANYQSGVGMIVTDPPATITLIQAEASPATRCGLEYVKVNNLVLVDTSGAQLQGRVNQRFSDTQLIIVPTLENVPFVPTQYLRAPSQRVAPWVYYNDPTRLLEKT